MFPINLFLISKTKPLNDTDFNDYISCITKSKCQLNIRPYERKDLYQLVDILLESGVVNFMDGFYYSYTIKQISKEFDLIKITSDFILNIEIKSQVTSTEKIQNQLISNKYYLKSLSKEIYLFTFVANTKKFYKLNSNNILEESNINDLTEIIKKSINYMECDLDEIIKPSYYLVSPFNNVDKFVKNEYFLTAHQQEIKDEIINNINHNKPKYYKILGDAGTGKTLLIYDIAKELSKTYNVGIIHSGILNDGHRELNERIKNLSIISAKNLELNMQNYNIIIIDEAHRLYRAQYDSLIKHTASNNTKIIFSIGIDQIMQTSESRANINGEIDKLQSMKEYQLTTKIRTNENLASFIKNVVNLKDKNLSANYDHINIYYTDTKKEADLLIKILSDNFNYHPISFTKSKFNRHMIDNFVYMDNTHTVIGQEFDNVAMIMGENFSYINDRLHSSVHPNPDYDFGKLFYQGITRARLNLAIIVFKNQDLYKQLIQIKLNK